MAVPPVPAGGGGWSAVVDCSGVVCECKEPQGRIVAKKRGLHLVQGEPDAAGVQRRRRPGQIDPPVVSIREAPDLRCFRSVPVELPFGIVIASSMR